MEPLPIRPVVAMPSRNFAVNVVRKLRDAGFQAYWAGGCVRDLLLNNSPKDYDVATNALPEQVRQVFGYRRTRGVGAAFGVILVHGSQDAGDVEVATFRQDVDYTDGRRPDRVVYSTAEQDALRRDFTINGMFFDPLEDRVIDYVGGQQDLHRRLVKAIGSPRERFEEDKLRLLRAVRFASTLGFTLDAETRAAVEAMSDQILVVSGERIREELRRMLLPPARRLAARMLFETGLLSPILPELVPLVDELHPSVPLTEWQIVLDVSERLDHPDWPLPLAVLLMPIADQAARTGRSPAEVHARIVGITDRLRCSVREQKTVAWLIEHRDHLLGAQRRRWSEVQPLLAHPDAAALVELHIARRTAIAALSGRVPDRDEFAYCRERLHVPREQLDPAPLVSGHDLIALGLPKGPRFAHLLREVRRAQLDGQIHNHAQALDLVQRLADQTELPDTDE